MSDPIQSLIQALKKDTATDPHQIGGEVVHGDHKLCWRVLGPAAQFKVIFDTVSPLVGGGEDAHHHVCKTTGWLNAPRWAVHTAIALFNRIPVHADALREFSQLYDPKDADLSLIVSSKQAAAEEEAIQSYMIQPDGTMH